ncbi:MAG TPA: homoserine kinase [Elusimicrobiota bacterium]|nr:homoserine kinase [Elusimicrobiota bacterium]
MTVSMRRTPPSFRVKVRVPASSANLGPGFDVVGLALTLYNEMELVGWADPCLPALTIRIEGEGADRLPLNGRNLVYQSVLKIFKRLKRTVPPLEIRLKNRIFLARGLGSSSSAIVGGLVAANAATGNRFSQDDILRMAVEEEGHPDNVTPALLGGLRVAFGRGDRLRVLEVPVDSIHPHVVVCVPDFELSTDRARRLLPVKVPFRDAVFNLSRVSGFLLALQQGRWDLVADAMEDRLHQPYRDRLVPGLSQVLVSAKKAGALGAALSGAGPSVMAFARGGQTRRVGAAMVRAFARRGVRSCFMDLKIDRRGTQVLG